MKAEKTREEEMKIKIGRFVKDTSIPNSCSACKEEWNGINYGNIYIDKLKIRIDLCDKCLKKLKGAKENDRRPKRR